MTEDIIYEGRLCTIRLQGEGFWVEADSWQQYERNDLLLELQEIMEIVRRIT